MNIYWWIGTDEWGNPPVSNWGDLLAPVVLSHFANITTTWSEPAQAEIVGIGSVLDVLPQSGWWGIVAGSGKLLESTATDLTQANVVGLRGPLTLENLKVRREHRHHLVLGDPALLASDMVNATPDKYPLGCLPHISDTELYPRELARAREQHYPEPTLIDPTGDPLQVVAMIGSCRKLISSSLHGLVVADAWGVPRRAERFAQMDTNPHQGSDFKFRDYGASIGQPIEFGTLQSPKSNVIERMQCDIFDMYRSLQPHC